MKQIRLLLMAALLISALAARSQKVIPGNVAGIYQIAPASNTGITNNQFETFYLEEFIPVFKKAFPSIPLTLMKGERGERMGKYAELGVFESIMERNRWFPEEGVSSDETKQGLENMGEIWDKYKQMTDISGTTDYIVLPFSGQRLNVKPGKVVCIWEIEYTLEEGMTFEQLEQFYIEEYIPAVTKNVPGIEYCVMKGERGERTSKYIEFAVFKSIEERNKWFPGKGESNENIKQALDKMREIQDRMIKLVASVSHTDYVVL